MAFSSVIMWSQHSGLDAWRARLGRVPRFSLFQPRGAVDRKGLVGNSARGTTSWHALALHLIARHVGPSEALRIAKVYLLKWHDECELPYSRAGAAAAAR